MSAGRVGDNAASRERYAAYRQSVVPLPVYRPGAPQPTHCGVCKGALIVAAYSFGNALPILACLSCGRESHEVMS